MDTIFILVVFGAAVFYLFYVRSLEEQVTARMQRGVAVSKYIVAIFVAVFGSAAIAVLLSSPLFLYSRFFSRRAGSDVWSALLDRPYFPLQTFIALALGYFTFRWFREGWPKFVWMPPLVQGAVAAAVYVHRFGPVSRSDIWRTFFDWDCRCSATLPQWSVMFPLYTTVAFALGATVRDTITSHRSVSVRSSGTSS